MPEFITLFDENGNPVEVEKPESPSVKQMRERIKELEAEAARVTELEARLTTRERSDALRAAGLDLDDVRLKALEAVHSGDWTPEAVKATAIQLGWMQPPQPIPPDEADALARLNAAQQGGQTTVPNPDADFDARLAQAKTEAEFMEIYRASGRPILQG